MTTEGAVELARQTLAIALWLSVPILAVATVVSLLISIVQVMTSIQEPMVGTVPRLAAAAGAAFVLTPWMLRKLMAFTLQLFTDFHRYLG
jgi:flagellar biosynthetic protein FliQ